ncbi:MAG: class I SAM-dependent methyltransferase [Thermoplasmata archaeon]
MGPTERGTSSSRVPPAARHFDASADVYERSRPEYPPEMVVFLGNEFEFGPGVRVLDVGAGTGKLSRALHGTGVDLTAVEPLEGMREVFRRELPDVPVIDGSAEELPCADASFDLIVVGQAFHWFHAPSALREMARVLRPRGGLALIWNTRDETTPWVKRFSELLEPYRTDTPGYRSGAWRAAFRGSAFTRLTHRTFRWVLLQDRDGVVDRALSVSFIAGLPKAEKTQVAHRVRDLLDQDPLTRGRDRIAFPYTTDVYFSRKK